LKNIQTFTVLPIEFFSIYLAVQFENIKLFYRLFWTKFRNILVKLSIYQKVQKYDEG